MRKHRLVVVAFVRHVRQKFGLGHNFSVMRIGAFIVGTFFVFLLSVCSVFVVPAAFVVRFTAERKQCARAKCGKQ